MRTQVAIVGAGPAGLMLAHLLARRGIESVVLESRSREYVEKRVRAGVLEQGTVDLLVQTGAGERMLREGLVHHGIELRFEGQRHRIPLTELTRGRSITVYGQQEVVKDLIRLRLAAGGEILFDAEAIGHRTAWTRPDLGCTFRHGGCGRLTLECDYVAGCDGFWGISRAMIPTSAITVFEKEYPFAWLGILAAMPPASEELIYAYHHEYGFALDTAGGRLTHHAGVSSRRRSRSRSAEWSDDRLWAELDAGWVLSSERGARGGADLAKKDHYGDAQLCRRAHASTGRLFLTGDAAHIVPRRPAPKGMNLAVADVKVLGPTRSAEWYAVTRRAELAGVLFGDVPEAAFGGPSTSSWWMTSMLHIASRAPTRFQAAGSSCRSCGARQSNRHAAALSARRELRRARDGLTRIKPGVSDASGSGRIKAGVS